MTILGTGGIGMILFIVSSVRVLIVDRLNRRPFMIGGSIVMAVAFVILIILAACRITMPDNSALSVAYANVAFIITVVEAISWWIVG
jgi:hypothetical protein